MRADEFTATVRVLTERRPFRPYTIVLVNGERYQIDYPLAISMGNGFAVHIAPGNVPVFLDHDAVSQIIGDFVPTPDDQAAA